jgi:hypothetical protein
VFHHIAMFRFRSDVPPTTITAVRDDLLRLPDVIDSVRSFRIGRDAGLGDTTWDMVLVATFDDEAGYRSYASHPDHLPVVRRIGELVTDRAAVQSAEM